MRNFKDYRNIDVMCENVIFEHEQEGIQEAEYQGRKVKLNDPFRTPDGPKKFGVYVKRRKSFRARHNCDNPGPKTKARYWSCFQWRAGAKVDN